MSSELGGLVWPPHVSLMAGLGTDRACGLAVWGGGCAPLPACPPACRVVPAGAREHSLALFSELWEAGCHGRSQELEGSPEVGEGQRMSAPSLTLSARPCLATGAPAAQGVSGGLGAPGRGVQESEEGVLVGGAAPLCSGALGVSQATQVGLHGHHHQGCGSRWISKLLLPLCRLCTAQSQGAFG